MCEWDYFWILICSKSLQCATLHQVRHGRSHIGSLHGRRYREDRTAKSLAQHLLGPLQEGSHMVQDCETTAEIIIEFQRRFGTQVSSVVTSALTNIMNYE